MKNLIYQYWDGNIPASCISGQANMKEYARRIGAEYLFEDNPKFVTNLRKKSVYYGIFKPVFDKRFHRYDNVLYADTDVFAVDGLRESIFDNFTADIGICTEPFQPQYRRTLTHGICGEMDEKWAAAVKSQWNVDMPRTPDGLLKVYNTGVVLFSHKGLVKARKKFVRFKKYVKTIKRAGVHGFYKIDQNYLHAMLYVANMDYVELDNGWNSYVHYYFPDPNDSKANSLSLNDMRTKDTKFVHIQLRGADEYDAQTLWRITNLPAGEWKLPDA